MPTATYTPARIEKFSGLNTLIDATNLPAFCSPDCQDVEFIPGVVRTRPGIVSQFTPLTGNPTVNYLKTYITDQLSLRMLSLDSLGVFRKENPQGTLNTVATIENTGVYGNSVSQFSREYLAFGDGKFGTSIPRQFDDVNFDRVSQVGPGQAPSVTDEIVTIATAAAPNGIAIPAAIAVTSASQTGSIVTLGVAVAGFNPGDNVNVAGVGVGYNGQWVVISAPPGFITYSANQTGLGALGAGGTAQAMRATVVTTAAFPATVGETVTFAGMGVPAWNTSFVVFSVITSTLFNVTVPLALMATAASGGGTVTTTGNIEAGLREFTVIFQTRNGYLTAPAPPGHYIAAGGRRAIVSNIPIGTSDVTARIICFTAVNAQSFFFTDSSSPIPTGNMILNDNTSTSLTVDFNDQALLSGTNIDDLFDLVELGECVGVTAYNSRLFWWGERNKVQKFNNLTFDGGFSQAAITGGKEIPLGWTATIAGFLGGKAATQIFGNAYVITGDGATAIAGRITQSAYQDAFGAPILETNKGYSVRVRLLKSGAAFATGTFHIHLQSTNAAIDTGLDIVASTLTTSFAEYIGVLTTGLTQIPTDLLVRVYVDGTPTNGAQVVVENIEVFPTNQPYNITLVRASRAPDANGLFGAESYNGVDGFLDIAPSNGQATRCCFVIRNNLYFAKERSLFVTQDDQANEPSSWIVQEISHKVGTLSARGVGLGDEWAVIAGQDGLYLFDGSQPEKISQEIQPTWDQINWQYGHLVSVTVDTKRKRIYILVPFGSSTIPNKTLTLDYTEGFSDPIGEGVGRKWCPWTISGNSMNLILRDNGTQQLFIGNNSSNGLIYQLDPTGTIFYDDFLIADSFNRANENPLSIPWNSVLLTTSLQLSSNQVMGTTLLPQFSAACYVGPNWNRNQSSKIKVVSLLNPLSVLSVMVRYSSDGSGDSFYEAFANGSNAIQIDYAAHPGSGVILATGIQAVNPGDTIELKAVYNDVTLQTTLTMYINGVAVLSATDSSIQVAGVPAVIASGQAALTDAVFDDWYGTTRMPINSYWQSGYFQDEGRMDFGYLTSNIVGSGSCSPILRKGNQGWVTNIRPWTLSNLGFKDMERTLGGLISERLAIRVGTNSAGDNFSLQGLSMYMRPAAYSPVRGINA